MADMQLKILEILQPEVQKLKNFMAFQVSFDQFNVITIVFVFTVQEDMQY